MKKSILLFVFLFCLSISNYAQLIFEEHTFVDSGATFARFSYSADLDGDGDLDVITAYLNQIIWTENEDGLGTFIHPKMISENVYGTNSIFATDLDGDGDMDVLTASGGDDKIAWYENVDGLGNFGDQQIITTYTDQPQFVHAGDFDGDGDMDVLSASYNDDKIAWYENEDGLGSFGAQQIITEYANQARFVNALDFDGDEDIDIVIAYKDNITWYENEDGLGTLGNPQIINEWEDVQFVQIADIDGDNDLDVLYISNDGNSKNPDYEIRWLQHLDGLGTFDVFQTIINSASFFSVCFMDVDGDSDKDVIFSTNEYNGIWSIENIDGLGNFSNIQSLLINKSGSFSTADLDGDGGTDIFLTKSSTVSWYKNEDGLGAFGGEQIINTPYPVNGPSSIFAADLDGDGDMDVLSASDLDDKIAWYKNEDGFDDFNASEIISIDADGATSVFATDLDGDGDVDVLSASQTDNKIAWYENEDGQGTFGAQQIISTSAEDASTVYAIDIDGDGDMDVLSASQADNKIAWYENEDGAGTFGAQQIITTSAEGAATVYAVDLDGDGDMDVLSASYNDDKIAWYENEDGAGTFGAQQIITSNANGAYAVSAADLDGDGDMDVLSTSNGENKIAWYENTDGLGNFGTQQIITTNANGANDVYSTDLDNDGDMDILSSSFEDGKIAWYENTNGLGDFSNQNVISQNGEGPKSVYAADIDGDGVMDVLSAYYTDNKLKWFESTIDTETPVAVCKNGSTHLNQLGEVLLTATDFNDGSTDDYGIQSYILNDSTLNCTHLGENNITLTVTDIAGNISSCNSIVTVIDDLPPVVSVNYVTVNLAGAPSIELTIDQVDNGSTDNCSITEMSLDQNIFDAPGEYVVNLSVVDNSGNVSTVGASVMVFDITAVPVAMCQDVSVLLSSNGTADIELADIDNNSLNDYTIESLEINQNEFTCSDLGANEVTLTVTDVLGNTGTCIAIVTVVDNSFTYLNTQNITIDLAGESSVTVTPEQINNGSLDNCEIISMTLDQTTFTEVGEYEVLFTGTDAGNNSKSEIAIVTVINSIVGVEDLNDFAKNLNIHPIPTTDQITIEAPKNIAQINIYNTQGQLLFSQNTNGGSVSNINLTNLAAGLYFCEVKDNEGNVGVRKIIKK